MDEAELAQLREEERKELESEKEAMLADQTIVKEEKARLLAEMEQREAELRQEAEAAAMLASQIKAMESKLLVGGKAIVVHTAEQERKLLARKKQIEEHNREKAYVYPQQEEERRTRAATLSSREKCIFCHFLSVGAVAIENGEIELKRVCWVDCR